MTRTTYLGFPRIGQRRELKRALETYWRDGHAAPLLALHFLYQNQTDNCEFNKGGQSMMLQFDFAPLESS